MVVGFGYNITCRTIVTRIFTKETRVKLSLDKSVYKHITTIYFILFLMKVPSVEIVRVLFLYFFLIPPFSFFLHSKAESRVLFKVAANQGEKILYSLSLELSSYSF